MKTMINIIKLRAVSSLNEVSLHMMECVQARIYYLTAEKRLQAILGENGQAQSQTSAASSVPSSVINGNHFEDSGVPGLNKKQQMVYQAIRESGSTDAQGLHINKVSGRHPDIRGPYLHSASWAMTNVTFTIIILFIFSSAVAVEAQHAWRVRTRNAGCSRVPIK